MNNKLFLVMILAVFSSFDVKAMSLTAAATGSEDQNEKYLPQLIGAILLSTSRPCTDQEKKSCQTILATAFSSAYFKNQSTLVLDSRPNTNEDVSKYLELKKGVIILGGVPYETLTTNLTTKLNAIKSIELADGITNPQLNNVLFALTFALQGSIPAAAGTQSAGKMTSYNLIIMGRPADNLLTKFNQK